MGHRDIHLENQNQINEESFFYNLPDGVHWNGNKIRHLVLFYMCPSPLIYLFNISYNPPVFNQDDKCRPVAPGWCLCGPICSCYLLTSHHHMCYSHSVRLAAPLRSPQVWLVIRDSLELCYTW